MLYDLRFPPLATLVYLLAVGGRHRSLVGMWVFAQARAAAWPRSCERASRAIIVDDVSKRFRLYHERNQSLKAR